jgi:hypothetical protein
MAIVLIVSLTGAPGCQLLRSHPPPQPPPLPPGDIATDIALAAMPEYRLLISSNAAPDQSRLIAFLTRVDNIGGDTFHFTPNNAGVVLPDGTMFRALDRVRANALLKRVTLSRSSGAASGAAEIVADSVRAQVSQTLLDERDLTSEQTLLGYVIVDTQQPLPSLDGTQFEVRLTRASDGAVLRQEHRFGTPPDAASPPPTP